MLITLRTEEAKQLFRDWMEYFQRTTGKCGPWERTQAIANASHHKSIPLT